MNKIVRYFMLLFGFAFMSSVIYLNCSEPNELPEQAGLLLLIISPIIVFFFITRNQNNYLKLLLPAILLFILYVYTYISYADSSSSTAAIALVFTPIAGFIILLVSVFTAYLIIKVTSRSSN